MAFCPECGEQAVDVFCETHLREQRPLIADIKPVTLTTCPSCDRIKVRGQWRALSSFDRFFKHHITFARGAQILEAHFPVPVIENKPKEFVLPVHVLGTVSKHIEPYEESYEVPLPVVYEPCDRCSLAGSAYFEGTLQIRNPNPSIIDYIDRKVQQNDDVAITGAKDVRGGVDFKLSDQKFLAQFVHELKRRFGGVVKTQSRLHTYDKQTSKQVYRLTALLRLPSFGRGDVIETDKKLLRIGQMGGQVKGFDLRHRKHTAIPCPADGDVIIHEIQDVVVSADRPTLTILDPDDYQEVPITTQAPATPGSTVRAVRDSRGKWYLVDDDGRLEG